MKKTLASEKTEMNVDKSFLTLGHNLAPNLYLNY
jgi:hypothetical protein